MTLRLLLWLPFLFFVLSIRVEMSSDCTICIVIVSLFVDVQ